MSDIQEKHVGQIMLLNWKKSKFDVVSAMSYKHNMFNNICICLTYTNREQNVLILEIMSYKANLWWGMIGMPSTHDKSLGQFLVKNSHRHFNQPSGGWSLFSGFQTIGYWGLRSSELSQSDGRQRGKSLQATLKSMGFNWVEPLTINI